MTSAMEVWYELSSSGWGVSTSAGTCFWASTLGGTTTCLDNKDIAE